MAQDRRRPENHEHLFLQWNDERDARLLEAARDTGEDWVSRHQLDHSVGQGTSGHIVEVEYSGLGRGLEVARAQREWKGEGSSWRSDEARCYLLGG